MLADLLRGCRFPFQGMAFLVRHRSLWTWAALPAAVNVGVFAAALSVFLYFFGTLYSLTTGWMYPAAPDFWLAWAWVVPLRVFAWSIGVVLLLAALLILYGAFLALGPGDCRTLSGPAVAAGRGAGDGKTGTRRRKLESRARHGV